MVRDPKVIRRKFLDFVEEVWIQNDHSLSDISCVYIIASYEMLPAIIGVKTGDIEYVGSTTKLFSRYKSHKVPSKIQMSNKMNILYYLPMDTGFYDYEIKLIKLLEPKYNVQHKKR